QRPERGMQALPDAQRRLPGQPDRQDHAMGRGAGGAGMGARGAGSALFLQEYPMQQHVVVASRSAGRHVGKQDGTGFQSRNARVKRA
ncbi:hypothetical protein, partial [Raoultella terrigena]|uniref:hypothetical protein n=1 Tax=Raoultella terrigena TaxID=577 RepID=UPI001C702832